MGSTIRKVAISSIVVLVSLIFMSNENHAQGGVILRVVDQNNVDIPGSIMEVTDLGLSVSTGSSIALPEGIHTFRLFPGVFGVASSNLLRDETAEVTTTTTELAFEWVTAEVQLRLHDQQDVDIPGSRLDFSGYGVLGQVSTGDAATVPITDESVYPSLLGNLKDGYLIRMFPGIFGVVSSNLLRDERVEVTTTTTELAFEWITAEVLLRLQDQHGVDIAGSLINVGSYGAAGDFFTGETATLLITDENVYPTLVGHFKNGYSFRLDPAVFGFPNRGQLHRVDAAEVTATTTDLAFEWIQIECAIQVVDANGLPVPGSMVVLPSPFPAITPGDIVLFLVTENSVYPTIAGSFANGYSITVTPGDIAPTSGTLQFEMLSSGAFEPADFVIGANTYGLVCAINAAPVVGAITAPLDPVQVNTAINASADFTDADTLDTHAAVWEWGDGSQCDTTTDSDCSVTEPLGSDPGSATGNHTYTTPGVYAVRLTVTDDDGATGESLFQFVVIYDPDGGFVTGGGWIDSPEGAYALDPSLTGKANFGFVSKYKKGANVPTGQTEFQFQVAELNFHSDTYDWLVVAGPTAKFKGTGTINGAGNYGFMITATDEKLTPSTDVDLFRIKIWDKDDNDTVVYDNKMDEDDDSDAGTEISGGNIVIHKK
jgi:hypothetical protein